MFDISLFSSLFDRIPFLVAYVRTGGVFLKPLPREKVQELLGQMKLGDKIARDKLIEHNLRLVAHIARKYSTENNNEDIISIGTIGLIKAINTYNMEKGTKLATYAARCIENEILMSIRANKKRNGDVSLNDPIGYDREGNSIALIDILGTDCDSVENFVNTSMQVEKIKRCIKKYLNPRERYIITNRYGCNGGPQLTQREIAAKLKISRSYVSRIEKKARKKLCFHMNNE